MTDLPEAIRAADRDRVSGRYGSVCDLDETDVLHGGTVRSPVSRGRILGIDFDEEFDWDTVVVVDFRDIQGPNVAASPDQPVLAEKKVEHRHEPVLLLAAADRSTLLRALEGVTINCEKRPAVEDTDSAVAARVRIHGEDNVFHELERSRGDAQSVFERTGNIVEESFLIPQQEHLYLEPHAVVARPLGQEGIRMDVPSAVAGDVVDMLRSVLGLSRDAAVDVRCHHGGGDLGGKSESVCLLAAHAALLARKSQRAVRMVYDRWEDMQATPKRHQGEITCRSACDAKGKLEALELDIVLDGGAYATVSPQIISRTVESALSAYRCGHFTVRGRVVATNTPPCGSFRGLEVPQAMVALEQHLNTVARVAGLNPDLLRISNLVDGREQSICRRVLEEVVEASDFHQKRGNYNAGSSGGVRRGIGLSLSHEVVERVEILLHVVPLESGMRVDVTCRPCPVPEVALLVKDEICSVLEIQTGQVRVDSDAFRGCGQGSAFREVASRAAYSCRGRLKVDVPLEGFVETACGLGSRAGAGEPPKAEDYRAAAHVVEVEVDMVTLQISIVNAFVCHEARPGTDEMEFRQRIEAATVMELGYARLEDVVVADGAMANHRLTHYVIPSAVDVPRLHCVLVESSESRGGDGVVSNGCAAALVDAVSQATNLSFRELPVTPERIAQVMLTKKGAR